MTSYRGIRLVRSVRIALALLLAGATACHSGGAAGLHPVVRRGTPTTDSSKVALNTALRFADRAGIEALFDSDATLGAPGAEDPEGSEAIATYLVSARDGLRIEGYDFAPDRMVQFCTNGERFEHGRVGIRMYDIVSGRPVRTAEGRYSLRWRERDGRHLITRMTFEEGETLAPLEAAICPPPPLDQRGYRIAVSLAVGARQLNSVPKSLERDFADAGWRQFNQACGVYGCLDSVKPRTTADDIAVAIGAEYRVRERVALLAGLERTSGAMWGALNTGSEYHRVEYRYRSLTAFVAPEAQWRYFGLAIGPTITRHWWDSRDDISRYLEYWPANRLVLRSAKSSSTAGGAAVQGRAGYVLFPGGRFDVTMRARFGGAADTPETETFPSKKAGGNLTTLSLGFSYVR